MSKLRSVSTAFWSDPFVEELTSNQKLLFLYLVTNEKTNMLGIYESSIKKMSFETGIKKDEIEKTLKEFEKVNKVKYINNFVLLVNYMKHQNFNTNMKKSAIDIYNSLPKELKSKDLVISKANPLEGFESLLNHYGMVSKREVEVEYETEGKEESKDELEKYLETSFNKFYDLYDKKTSKEKSVLKWAKLKKEDHDLILKHIPKYKVAQPDKKYRKDPITYLNNKSWLDEIINNNTSNKPQTSVEKREYDGQQVEDEANNMGFNVK